MTLALDRLTFHLQCITMCRSDHWFQNGGLHISLIKKGSSAVCVNVAVERKLRSPPSSFYQAQIVFQEATFAVEHMHLPHLCFLHWTIIKLAFLHSSNIVQKCQHAWDTRKIDQQAISGTKGKSLDTVSPANIPVSSLFFYQPIKDHQPICSWKPGLNRKIL